MFDIKWIRDNPDAFDEGLKKRGLEPVAGQLVEMDEARRNHLTALQEAQSRRNAASKEIGKAMAANDQATADRLKAEVAELKDFIQTGEEKARQLEGTLNDALAAIPNLPLDEVPVGADENDNVEVRRWGEPDTTK